MKHTHCVECNHPLRTSKQSAKDYPGTRAHQGRGLCSACYQPRKGAFVPPPKPAETYRKHQPGARPSVESLHAERARFDAARRKRGVPAAGRTTLRRPIAS